MPSGRCCQLELLGLMGLQAAQRNESQSMLSEGVYEGSVKSSLAIPVWRYVQPPHAEPLKSRTCVPQRCGFICCGTNPQASEPELSTKLPSREEAVVVSCHGFEFGLDASMHTDLLSEQFCQVSCELQVCLCPQQTQHV